MWENMSARMPEDVCYGSQGKCLWVMLHFALGNAAKIMLYHLIWRTAANTCGWTFRVQANEVGFGSHVGACGGTSLRQSSLARPAGLQRRWVCVALCLDRSWDLSACVHGAALAPSMLGIVCSLCHRLWRALCGMWCTMGELFQMRKASKSWRSVLQSFELWRPLCQCCAEQGQLHRRGARGTGIFMVCTRHEM